MQTSRPLIAEIVGPAGTGKTTLSNELNERGGPIHAGITIWGQPIIAVLIGALISLPTIFSVAAYRKRFQISDLKQVVRLNALYRRINQMRRSTNGVRTKALFMDEGVVFALGKFRFNTSGELDNPSDPMIKWERKMIDQWSQTLNAIVWLDGPDELLTERIRNREKEHRMKKRSDKEIVDFLSLYRSSYQKVISELAARGRIDVVKLQTGDVAPAQMAQEIVRLVEQPGV